MSETYPIEISGVKRELPLIEVAPGVRIALLNILGDTELIKVSAKALAEKLADSPGEVIVTAEAKSIPLCYEVAAEMNLPWVVLRKSYKPYMGDAIHSETLSITTGKPQTLFLDEKDSEIINGAQVILVDDVISTGSTLQGMQLIINKAGGEIASMASIFTEGDRAKWSDIVALGHLPVLSEDATAD